MVYVFVTKKKKKKKKKQQQQQQQKIYFLLNRLICSPLFVSLYLTRWNRYFSKSLFFILDCTY